MSDSFKRAAAAAPDGEVAVRPLVSCIVPSYNHEDYVSAALDSIFAQTYRSIEVIVVDSGSSDRTVDRVLRYGDRLTLVRGGPDGIAVTRNIGVTKARGELVAFLDSDDLWLPEKLERQVAAFDAEPTLDVCATMIENFWGPELDAERTKLEGHRMTRPRPGFTTTTLLVRRSVFDRVGLFEPAYRHGDSGDWILRAIDAGCRHHLVDEVLVRRRIHRGNFSRDGSGFVTDEMFRMLKASLDRQRSSAAAATGGTAQDLCNRLKA